MSQDYRRFATHVGDAQSNSIFFTKFAFILFYLDRSTICRRTDTTGKVNRALNSLLAEFQSNSQSALYGALCHHGNETFMGRFLGDPTSSPKMHSLKSQMPSTLSNSDSLVVRKSAKTCGAPVH